MAKLNFTHLSLHDIATYNKCLYKVTTIEKIFNYCSPRLQMHNIGKWVAFIKEFKILKSSDAMNLLV